ncbi:MAG: YkgJ family cysteine cluster protein [Myxococcales bacterium]|nr:YkgJ family cysteine cluster protein [Myxococcales bacterium]
MPRTTPRDKAGQAPPSKPPSEPAIRAERSVPDSSPEETLGDREQRLARIVTQLDTDARYAMGSRRFPGHVSPTDAIEIAAALADELDDGARARAQKAEQQGMQIACDIGCHRCCTVVVTAYQPEILRIAQFLEQPENAAEKKGFLDRYSAWRAAVGDEVEALPQTMAQGQQAEIDRLHFALWRRGALCAFNEGGICTIYPVRPLACRNAHALDTDAYCVPDPPGGKRPTMVDFVPMNRFLNKATRLLHAAHNAIAAPGQRHQQEALCSSVFRLLTSSAKAP